MKKENIIKVSFVVPPSGDGITDYYFGSLKAVYSRFNAMEIGLACNTLYKRKLPLKTSFCEITRHPLTRNQK